MLVLDKSGAMAPTNWDHDNNANTPNTTRWSSLYRSVEGLIAEKHQGVHLGVTLFPQKGAKSSYDMAACIVASMPDVDCSPTSTGMILSVLPPEGDMGSVLAGATPTHSAMKTAILALKSGGPSNARAIILATEGAAQCSQDAANNEQLFELYDQASESIVEDAWKNDNIPTYVVGIGVKTSNSGTNQDGDPDNIIPSETLNTLALNGGKPRSGSVKFYNATSESQIESFLKEIALDAMSCDVILNDRKTESIVVSVNGEICPHVLDCAVPGQSGWSFSNIEKTRVSLCGAWCDAFKSQGKLTIENTCG